MKYMKQPKQVPLWLRRLGLVKAELKGAHFPRSAEEGLRQVAALSAANLRILRAEVRSAPQALPPPRERPNPKLSLPCRVGHATCFLSPAHAAHPTKLSLR